MTYTVVIKQRTEGLITTATLTTRKTLKERHEQADHVFELSSCDDRYTFSGLYGAVPEALRDSLSDHDIAMIVDAMLESYRAGYKTAVADHKKREAATTPHTTRPAKQETEPLEDAAPLSGSDEQIAWANDLRAKAVAWAKETIAKIEDPQYVGVPQETKATIRERGDRTIALMLAETSAKTIIDHRNNLVAYYKDLAH